MATGNSGNHVRNMLALPENPTPKNEYGRFIKVFKNVNVLHQYICAHIKDADNFHLHVSDRYLEELIEKGVHKIEEVRRIDVYCATGDARQSGQIRYPSGSEDSKKLKFCLGRVLEGQLENAETGGVVDSSGQIDRSAIHNVVTSKSERLHTKRANGSDRHSPEPKRFAPTVHMQNIGPRFTCAACKMFFQEPYQLECGHRLCKSCLNIHYSCPVCLEFIAKDKTWFDQGFENEKQDLLTTCLECQWTGSLLLYQGHRNQNHRELSNYSISNEQVAQNSLRQQIPSTLHLARLGNNSNVDNNHIQGVISTLLNPVHILNDGASGTEINQNLLYQEYLSLKERISDAQAASFDGTFIWKITNFTEERMKAQLQRQTSIYSPPFYSSRTGYKMRLRLFLNGDNNTRGTHMSLFIVLMRGDYDRVLHWPFEFKVTFTLLNQLQSNNNQSKSFWSDIRSTCFQCPITDMNIPYGFSKFFPHDVFKQNENYFVRDDTLFIKVEVDFTAKISEIPWSSDASELINDGEHDDTTDDDLSRTICRSDTSQ